VVKRLSVTGRENAQMLYRSRMRLRLLKSIWWSGGRKPCIDDRMAVLSRPGLYSPEPDVCRVIMSFPLRLSGGGAAHFWLSRTCAHSIRFFADEKTKFSDKDQTVTNSTSSIDRSVIERKHELTDRA